MSEAEGGGSTVEWSSQFAAKGAPEGGAARAIEGLYQAGFDTLRKMFGGLRCVLGGSTVTGAPAGPGPSYCITIRGPLAASLPRVAATFSQTRRAIAT